MISRNDVKERMERARKANVLLKTTAKQGPFFRSKSNGAVARFHVMQDGRIYYEDEWSGRLIYRMGLNRPNSFGHGRGLYEFVLALREFIKTGARLHPTFGKYWGYRTEPMQRVRDTAAQLGMTDLSWLMLEKTS